MSSLQVIITFLEKSNKHWRKEITSHMVNAIDARQSFLGIPAINNWYVYSVD